MHYSELREVDRLLIRDGLLKSFLHVRNVGLIDGPVAKSLGHTTLGGDNRRQVSIRVDTPIIRTCLLARVTGQRRVLEFQRALRNWQVLLRLIGIVGKP